VTGVAAARDDESAQPRLSACIRLRGDESNGRGPRRPYQDRAGRGGKRKNGGAASINAANLKAGLWTELARWYARSPLLQHPFMVTKTKIFHRSRNYDFGYVLASGNTMASSRCRTRHSGKSGPNVSTFRRRVLIPDNHGLWCPGATNRPT
jgi:hypothetical protein